MTNYKKIAFQGSFGAHSDLACRNFYPDYETVACDSFGDVFDLEIESQNTNGVIQNANVLVRNLTLNGYQF